MTTVHINTSPIAGLLSLLLTILALIGRWHIFEKNGKAGWKAIIPFYNNKVYGDISDSPGLGIADMVIQIVAIGLSLFVLIALGLSAPTQSYTYSYHGNIYMDPNFAYYESSPSLGTGGVVALFLGIILFILLIVGLVIHYIIRYRFNKKNGYPQWWMLFWIFLSEIPEIYFGLIDGKYTITKIEDEPKPIEKVPADVKEEIKEYVEEAKSALDIEKDSIDHVSEVDKETLDEKLNKEEKAS